MLTYIRVSFFFQKRVWVSFLKIWLRLGLVFVLGLGLGFRFEFGFVKLIGCALGTVGWVSRKPPVKQTHRQDRLQYTAPQCKNVNYAKY